MAFSRNTTDYEATGDGVTTAFFPTDVYWSLDDVRVEVDDEADNVYSVDWVSDPATTSPQLVRVTFNAPVNDGVRIVIGFKPTTESVDPVSASNFTPAAINKQFDRVVSAINTQARGGGGSSSDAALAEYLFGTPNYDSQSKILDRVIPADITRDTELAAIQTTLEGEIGTKLDTAQVQALIDAAISSSGTGVTGAEVNNLIMQAVNNLNLGELIKNAELDNGVITFTKRDDSTFEITLPTGGGGGVGDINKIATDLFETGSRSFDGVTNGLQFNIPAEDDNGVAGTHEATTLLGTLTNDEASKARAGVDTRVSVQVEHRDTRTGQRPPTVTAQLQVHNTLFGDKITLPGSTQRTLTGKLPDGVLQGQSITVVFEGTNNSGVAATGLVFVSGGELTTHGPGTEPVTKIAEQAAENALEPVAAKVSANEQTGADNATAIAENKQEIATLERRPQTMIGEKLRFWEGSLEITTEAGRFVLHSGYTFGAYVAYELDRTQHTLKTTDEGISVNSAGSLTGLGESYRKVIGVTARAAVNGISG